MVTWTDVRTWRHGPLEEAGESLRSVGTTVADLKQDAQCAGTQIISQALGVDAARAALGRYTASHGEFHDQVACLTRATFEASAGAGAGGGRGVGEAGRKRRGGDQLCLPLSEGV